ETGRLTQNVGYHGLEHPDEDIQCASTSDESDVPEFFRRAKQGTDIYIVGFRLQDWKPAILRSVLEHFFAAIDNRQLEVIVREGEGEEDRIWIDKGNIADLIREQIDETSGEERTELLRAYHSLLALREGEKFSKEIDKLGLVHLYVNQHEKAQKRITYMRSPRMKVYDSGSTLLREFQAVLLVDNEKGNDFLKSLEDPKHEKWDPDQPDGWSDEDREAAKETLLEITRFIRETLKGLRRNSDNVAEDLPELSKWLPAEEDEGEWNVSAGAISGESTDEETSSEHTPDSEVVVTVAKRQRTQTVEAATDATTGEADGETGGGGGDQQSEGGTLGGGDIPGEGEGSLGGDEIGGQRIRASDVRFRSWQRSSSGDSDYRLVITSPGKNVTGELQLVAVGETARSQLEMNVLNATDCQTGKPVDVVRGKIVDLELRSGIARRIDVELDIDVVVSLAVKG
ncbi:hypothetical protein OAJ60_04450, partial [Planctomycetaceae bacterium]|nr:hypothetical protein [Planctomycetaceae bacterium]